MLVTYILNDKLVIIKFDCENKDNCQKKKKNLIVKTKKSEITPFFHIKWTKMNKPILI